MAAPTVKDYKKLEDELKDLKEQRFPHLKLPAKAPNTYKKSDGDFAPYAGMLLNYFKVMNVQPEDRPTLLLTYLNPQDYEAVVQVYPAEKLAADNYDAAVEKISKILSENITRAGLQKVSYRATGKPIW